MCDNLGRAAPDLKPRGSFVHGAQDEGLDLEVLVAGPLGVLAQVLSVGLEGSAAVAGQERRSRQLRLVR